MSCSLSDPAHMVALLSELTLTRIDSPIKRENTITKLGNAFSSCLGETLSCADRLPPWLAHSHS